MVEISLSKGLQENSSMSRDTSTNLKGVDNRNAHLLSYMNEQGIVNDLVKSSVQDKTDSLKLDRPKKNQTL